MVAESRKYVFIVLRTGGEWGEKSCLGETLVIKGGFGYLERALSKYPSTLEWSTVSEIRRWLYKCKLVHEKDPKRLIPKDAGEGREASPTEAQCRQNSGLWPTRELTSGVHVYRCDLSFLVLHVFRTTCISRSSCSPRELFTARSQDSIFLPFC